MKTNRGTVRVAVASVALGAVLGGCSTDLNARRTIGGLQMPPAVAGAAPSGEWVGTLRPAGRLDRNDWAPVEYRVPYDGTVHTALLRSSPSFGDEHPRAHGLYPTTESALDLGSSRGSEAARGVVEPVRAVVDLAILPIRFFTDPVWGKKTSPSNYKRWRSGEWLAGPVPVEGFGETDAGGGS